MYFVLGGKQGNAQGHVLRTRIENHGFARASVTYGGELSLATNPHQCPTLLQFIQTRTRKKGVDQYLNVFDQ